MAENIFGNINTCKETVCIDTYRVLDSCRDRDFFKDEKCYLTSYGQDIIERTDNVRVKWAKVLSAHIDIDEVPFNCGFYQLTTRIFIKLICEACCSPGNMQEFEAVCPVEKKVILYGGEGSVKVFKSRIGCSSFCPDPSDDTCVAGDTKPVALIETVDPIVLDVKVREACYGCNTCCQCRDIPQSVLRCMGGELAGEKGQRIMSVSLGLFSVVRIERPAQLLVSASEYNVPEKQCPEVAEEDPAAIFGSIPFPEKEFNSSLCNDHLNGKRCGCSK